MCKNNYVAEVSKNKTTKITSADSIQETNYSEPQINFQKEMYNGNQTKNNNPEKNSAIMQIIALTLKK